MNKVLEVEFYFHSLGFFGQICNDIVKNTVIMDFKDEVKANTNV
jgi:hypothetical protein